MAPAPTPNMSEGARQVLEALRSTSADYEQINADNSRWAGIYLDNVKRPAGLSPAAFAGFLAALEKRGLYKQIDGKFFGEVRLVNDGDE